MIDLKSDQVYSEPEVPSHPFLREVWWIAKTRWGERASLELADRYSRANGKKLLPRHVQRHFETRRLSNKVRNGYALALGMSERYLELLDNPGRPSYGRLSGGAFGLFSYHVSDVLQPHDVEPLFESGTIGEVLNALAGDKDALDHCLYDAELAAERYALTPALAPPLSVNAQAVLVLGVSDELLAKWNAIAPLLQSRFGIDLNQRLRERPATKILRESLLDAVWSSLHAACSRNFEDGDRIRDDIAQGIPDTLQWDEWLAVKSLVTMIARRRRLSIDEMVHRLNCNQSWEEWADDNDPEIVAAHYEAMEANERERDAI